MDELEQDNKEQEIAEELGDKISGTRRRKASRFIASALGALPWVGGVMSAVAAHDAEQEQTDVNMLILAWMNEHYAKIEELKASLNGILDRLEELEELGGLCRTDEEDFLQIVRKAFRVWDIADTQKKRDMICRVIMNAGATELCSDDVVRLFIDWMNNYHELHFSVISAIYNKAGITRAEIWKNISSKRVREDSAEAALFSRIIRDLSTGGVIRQYRPTDHEGRYLKKAPKRRGRSTMKSAFDDVEPYVLTALGEQFVHYALQDQASRISSPIPPA